VHHDLPYHDYFSVYNSDVEAGLNGKYEVGLNNKEAGGDQSKFFVSKRANIWTDNMNTTVQFNDSRNVAMRLEPFFYDTDMGGYWCKKEYYTNITVVYYTIPLTAHLYMYFEGIEPEEARDAR
jgi:hypothetical protein